PALLTLYAGFAVGTGMCALAPTYEFLVGARLLAGSFGGVLGSLVLAIVGDVIPYARRGAAMGVITSAFSVASVAGVPTGLYIAAHLGWHATFLALAGLCVLILLVAVWIVPSIRGHLVDSVSRHPLETLKVMLFNRNHTRVFLFVAMLMFGGFTVFPFISPYLVYNLGIQESDLTYVYGLGGLFTIFTSRIIGKLADRYGKPRVFGIVASLSAIPTLAVTSLPAMALPWVLVCTTFFFILASGRSVPAFAMITASVDSSLRGSFMSFNSSIQMWSAGLASFAAGVLITNGPHGELFRYGWVGVMASSSTIACVFLANRLKQPDVSHQ
ncbi:MAG: MFS transporter, partial [Bacteroidota bacterium]